MNVATRSSPVIPSSRSACASWAARAPTSAKLAVRVPSPVQVDTVDAACTVEPYVSSRAIDSGTSCMVLLMTGSVPRHQSGRSAIPLWASAPSLTPSTWCSWMWFFSKPTREPAR